MTNYLLAYTGGTMAAPEEQEAVMAAWGAWFGGLGSAVVDPGNPVGASTTVTGDGGATPGAPAGITGYSVLAADDLAAAAALAKGCPHLSSGGAIEVYEVIPAM